MNLIGAAADSDGNKYGSPIFVWSDGRGAAGSAEPWSLAAAGMFRSPVVIAVTTDMYSTFRCTVHSTAAFCNRVITRLAVRFPNPTRNLRSSSIEMKSGEIELDDGGEEEEEEAVFVLTDEWRDFFAKSEANRNLQAKKKGKKNKMQGS
ncbi:hypothetical protein M569_06107 [Genlisea aurea]|uniref:Uncharacterized protein n=1 Tax=Genlisea aurea TaxID=192259 RepID=S8CNA8_9LAMI|nr:hypothetical protein M569_06107 [Genlisea aurea]